MAIDILSFLKNNNIQFKTSGTNVTSGWIEISCPYPYCPDPSFHCGINIKSNLHSCWICGSKGNMNQLVMRLLKCSYSDAIKEVNKYNIDIFVEEKVKPTYNNPQKIDLSNFSTELPTLHYSYLLDRNFDPEKIKTKYKILSCFQTGKFAYRIIIPIFIHGTLVNYVARDVSGKQQRYKNLSNDKAIIPIKQCLYNIDSIKDRVIICEGPFDVWRIGDNAIATLGTSFTSEQLGLLATKEIKKAVVFYDSDATRKAEMLADALTAFIDSVDIYVLDYGDPAGLSDEEIKKIDFF
jgi:DNA primase